MLLPIEAFLLDRGDQEPVLDERGACIAVEGVDPEDVHDWISYAVPPALPMSRCVRPSYRSFICRPTRAQSYFAARRRAAAPMLAARSGSRNRRKSAVETASGVLSTHSPAPSRSTASQGVLRLTTTGVPHAIASTTAMPKVSRCEGNTKTADCASNRNRSGPCRVPT